MKAPTFVGAFKRAWGCTVAGQGFPAIARRVQVPLPPPRPPSTRGQPSPFHKEGALPNPPSGLGSKPWSGGTSACLQESVDFVHSKQPFAARHTERRMSRYRPCPKTESLAAQAPLALQLELPLLAPVCQPRNPARSKRRRSRLSPSRIAKFEEMRARRGTAQVSYPENNDASFLRQDHIFKLTPSLMSFIKADISGKRGQSASATLPSLEKCKKPEPISGCAHVGRGSPRRLQTNPLGLYRRRAGLPALRLPRRLQLQVPARLQVQGV